MEVFEILRSIGLGGVFLISFISNVIPYSAMPYLAFVTAYSIAAPYERLLITLLGGLGATLGKVVLYLISELIGKKIGKARRENIEYMKKIVKGKSAFLVIFLFAALPLPDDVIYIPLGIVRYSLLWFILPLFLGKTLLVGLFSLLGVRARWVLEYSIQSGLLYLTIPLLFLLTIEIILIVFFVNWMRVYMTYEEKGVKEGLRVLLQETILVLRLRHPDLRNWLEGKRKRYLKIEI